MLTITIRFEDTEGWENEHKLPAKWEICSSCNGNGSHDHPAIGGITSSEWAGWDSEEREDYLSGAYDVPCRDCDSAGKVLVIAEDKLTTADQTALDAFLFQEAERARWDRMEAMERAMGA